MKLIFAISLCIFIVPFPYCPRLDYSHLQLKISLGIRLIFPVMVTWNLAIWYVCLILLYGLNLSLNSLPYLQRLEKVCLYWVPCYSRESGDAIVFDGSFGISVTQNCVNFLLHLRLSTQIFEQILIRVALCLCRLISGTWAHCKQLYQIIRCHRPMLLIQMTPGFPKIPFHPLLLILQPVFHLCFTIFFK